jgi:cytochrome c-type biogenesis protein CcmH/NrfG
MIGRVEPMGAVMRAIAMVVTAALACAAPGWAQQSEENTFSSIANQQQYDQREVTQHNIDQATSALRIKDYKTARKYAQPVTRADPKRIEAWLLLGTAQLGLQDYQGARKTYTTAVRLSNLDPEARAGLAIAYARTKDPKATVQLAWLNEKIAACAGRCAQAAQLTRLKTDVELALAEAAKGG